MVCLVLPKEQEVLINLARTWQSKSMLELQEALVEEKLRQTKLKEELDKYKFHIKLSFYWPFNVSISGKIR